MHKLIDFLVTARRETYAIPTGTKIADGFSEMRFEEGDWRYRDRYTGINPYGGHEFIWHKDQPVWMKSYIAEIISDTRSPDEIYAFQREVLGKPDPSHPMRGPARYKNGSYRYENSVVGDLARFHGEESILFQGETVYRMMFHGGLIGQSE
jgi:hypothetical protein